MGQKIQLTEEQAHRLAREEGDDELDLELVEETDSEIDCKDVIWSNIYLQASTGKHFIQHNSRTNDGYWGDPDFEYGQELVEVKKKEVVRTEWCVVK